MKKEIKIKRPWLWIIITTLIIYSIIADNFFEYVINREMEKTLQYPLVLLFLVVTYYTLKIVWRQIQKINKKEER